MRVLLDTHALPWSFLEPGKLSKGARKVIVEPSTTLFVSSASAWEIATKHRLGKLPEVQGIVAELPKHLKTLRAEILPIGLEYASRRGSWKAPATLLTAC